MSRIDEFIQASERANTQRSYASAIQHFEVEWKGLLPTTSEAVARYLSDHAASLSSNTLRHRLAALSRWHSDHGFADPTKALIVRQVLKGIRSVYPAMEKRARPLILDQLHLVDQWLQSAMIEARSRNDQPSLLRHTRDRALVLLGFWRGFRSDELIRLKLENIQITPGEGMTCYLERSKTDKNFAGRSFNCPALSRMCPVAALTEWITLAELSTGPVFRRVDRWGHVAEECLGQNSLIPMLRKLFAAAGLASAQEYSSHSLRRGFASWARASGWDIKDLMEYVGWTDIKSAMRYLETSPAGMQDRFEEGLRMHPSLIPIKVASASESPVTPAAATVAPTSIPLSLLRITLSLSLFAKGTGSTKRCLRLIEKTCLERHTMRRLNDAGIAYELQIPSPTRQALDDSVYTLLDDMVQIAEANRCFLEVSVHEPATASYWN